MIRASVVVPHYEDPDRLRRCLEGLARAPEAALAKVEVVVVDNASACDLSWIAREFPFARLVIENERGAAAARNRGIRETKAARIAFLDCDCVPADDWLLRVLDVTLAPQGEIVGGEVLTFDETPPPRSGPQAFETVFAFDQKDYVERKGFSVTANMVTSRALFDRVGDLRAGVSEDVEWCRRAVAQGARISYDPRLSVRHPTRRDWPSLQKKWMRMTRETFGIEGDNRAAWFRKAALMPLSAVYHAPRILFSPRLTGLRERVSGVATLFRIRMARAWWMVQLACGRRLG